MRYLIKNERSEVRRTMRERISIKRLCIAAAFVLLLLVMIRPSGAQAASKPTVRETKVILYTDSTPYEFHFANLASGAKLTYSSSDESVIKIRSSKAVPLKKGKATVTVKVTQNKKTYALKVKFTVKNVPKVKTEKDYKKLADKTLKRLKNDLIDKTWVVLDYGDDVCCSSREELDKYIYKRIWNCSAFAVSLTDLKLFRSEEEYVSMFPFLEQITFTEPTHYMNCFMVVIHNTKIPHAHTEEEFAVEYALRGGDTSFLTKSQRKLYKKVVKIAEKLRKDSVYETVKAIHDYVVKKCEYEYDKSNKDRYTLRSAIYDGKTVCSGYTKLFCALCTALDINSKFVIGGGVNGELGDHAWCVVEIGHKWYGVDATWDDGGKTDKGKHNIKYKYFLIADEDMKKDHKWDGNLYPKSVSKDLGIVYAEREKTA